MMISTEPNEGDGLLCAHLQKKKGADLEHCTSVQFNWICSKDAQHITSEMPRLVSIKQDIGCFKVIHCGVYEHLFLLPYMVMLHH